MKDKINISTDGVCVYIDSQIQISRFDRISVILLSLFAFAPFFIMIYSFSTDNSKELVFGMISYLVIVGGITLRFALWKLFGEEFISVNTKSIKYQRSYGIIRINPKTIEINELSIAFNKRETDKDGQELGNIYFYDYDQHDQSSLVFESTMFMNYKLYEEFESQLSFIFFNKRAKNGEIGVITLN
jgi:hypothetical protein